MQNRPNGALRREGASNGCCLVNERSALVGELRPLRRLDPPCRAAVAASRSLGD